MPLPGNAVARALEVALPGVAAWMLPIAWSDEAIASVVPLLAEGEHARAGRFTRPQLRERYIAGRATLRMLLGRALDIPPAAVPIVRGARGRPQLDLAGAPDFNVSHTRDAAIIAVVQDGAGRLRIGVDLERADREVDASRLARKFCTPREREAMAGLDADASRRRFLRLWTCKEAMSKATGDGIGAPMGRIGVDVDGDAAAEEASPNGGNERQATGTAPALSLAEGTAPYLPGPWRLAALGAPPSHYATAALWQRPG